MRLFIQMSVAGFKIFDVNQFRHVSDNGRYALMSEISSTHNGNNNVGTHIIRDNMHGMRLETMYLFSSRDVIMLLHNDFCDGKAARCFYTDKYSLTTDEFNRDCDVSLCLMSESADEIETVNRIGYLLMAVKKPEIMGEFQNLLRRETIEGEIVLLFDTVKWQNICQYASTLALTHTSPLIDSIAKGDTQVVVLSEGQDRYVAAKNRKGLFNNDKYWVLSPSHLPLQSKTLSLPSQTVYMSLDNIRSSTHQRPTESDNFKDLINAIKDIFTNKNIKQ